MAGYPKWKEEVIAKYNNGEIDWHTYLDLMNGSASEYKVWLKGGTSVPIGPAQKGTQQILDEIEARTLEAYEQAAKELAEKAEKRLKKFDEMLVKQQELLDKGVITQKEFVDWAVRQELMNEDLKTMAEVLAKDLHNTNLIATKIATDGMADVYALNANYTMYDIWEQGGMHPNSIDYNEKKLGTQQKIASSFTLYNHDTAELLLKTEWGISPESGKNALLPAPSKKKLKELKELKKTSPDQLWNQQHLQSAILQGVLQGEPSWKIAERLKSVAAMDQRQAIRNARTMTTNVQNMGRQRSYLHAKDMGIDLVIEWCANIDGVTRHSHRQLHGERRNNTKTGKFSNGCRWPGDPQGPAAEVYNCRCTTLSWVKGFEHEPTKDNPYLQNQHMTFEEWQNALKKPSQAAAPAPAATAPKPATKKAPKAPAVEPYKDVIANAQEFSPRWHEAENFSQTKWARLSKDERIGVEQYTGASYVSMNDYLRGITSSVSARIKGFIDGCTSALEKSTIAADTILYRGMGSYWSLARSLGIDRSDVEKIVRDGSIKGQRFVEKGFCSTGVSKDAGWSKSVVLEIVAPKGTKGMYVDPISRHRGEKELLLQRGTIFEIRDAVMDGGRIRLKVVVAGTETH